MSAGKYFKIFALLAALLIVIAILSTGWAGIQDLTEDKSYLTPIPRETYHAFQFGQPVKTKLQAVIAAQHMINTTRLELVGSPIPIFVEQMAFKEAIQRTEQPGGSVNHDPSILDNQVWLVVFEGDSKITDPMGTTSAPSWGCSFAVADARDGMGMQAGSLACSKLKLEP